MTTELGEAAAEGDRVEGRSTVELNAIRESVGSGSEAEDTDGRGDAFARGDDCRKNEPGVVIDDGEDVNADPGRAGESDGERPLAVELPALVGACGFDAIAELA